MSFLKSTLFALAAASALAGPVLAQGEGMHLRESQVMIVMPDGRTMMRTIRDRAMLEDLVKKGKPLAAGQMVVMSGGKTYIVEDSRMPDGKMMTDMLILMSAN